MLGKCSAPELHPQPSFKNTEKNRTSLCSLIDLEPPVWPLELVTDLPPIPSFWNYKQVPPLPARNFYFFRPSQETSSSVTYWCPELQSHTTRAQTSQHTHRLVYSQPKNLGHCLANSEIGPTIVGIVLSEGPESV